MLLHKRFHPIMSAFHLLALPPFIEAINGENCDNQKVVERGTLAKVLHSVGELDSSSPSSY